MMQLKTRTNYLVREDMLFHYLSQVLMHFQMKMRNIKFVLELLRKNGSQGHQKVVS